MELVIAVILGVILLVKFGSDKSAVKNTRDEYDKKQQKISEWKSVVTDRSLEQRLKSFIQSPENKEQVSKEVAPVYEGIFSGKQLSELFPKERWCKPKAGWSPEYHEQVQKEMCMKNSENALRIMMAKHGKILDYDADRSASYSPSVMSSGISADSPLTAYVLIWCAKAVEEHGVPNIFVVPSIGKYGAGNIHWEL